MSALGTTLVSSLNQAHSDCEAILAPFLLEAENQLMAYSREMSLSPEYDVATFRQQIMAKRVELWSKALADYNKTMAPVIANAIADTVHSYLMTNNKTAFIPASLAAPGGSGGPVIASGPYSGRISYP